MSDNVLCLDSNIVIWGFLPNGKTETEQKMKKKVSAFLQKCFNEKIKFAISIISLSEFFVQIPENEKTHFLEIFQKNFIILDFNLAAAMQAASIFHEQYGKMKRSYYESRGILRQDIQILATILAFGKLKLITEDYGFQKLAANYGIPVSGIPEFLEQGYLL